MRQTAAFTNSVRPFLNYLTANKFLKLSKKSGGVKLIISLRVVFLSRLQFVTRSLGIYEFMNAANVVYVFD